MQNVIAKSRWYRLIPIAFITYSLAYLDRANFGFGAAGGMAKDLGVTPGNIAAPHHQIRVARLERREHARQQVLVMLKIGIRVSFAEPFLVRK